MRNVPILLLLLLTASACSERHALPTITVYKSPTCGCCNKWIHHLVAHGFSVDARDVYNLSIYKQRAGLTPRLASCHTAFVDGYAIEGHVPAADIKRLLETRPPVRGLAVPGMPIGSPGMEQGDRRDPYDVLAYGEDGVARIFSSH